MTRPGDLLQQLVEEAARLHDLAKRAQKAGREDVAQQIRNSAWDIGAAIARLGDGVEVAS